MPVCEREAEGSSWRGRTRGEGSEITEDMGLWVRVRTEPARWVSWKHQESVTVGCQRPLWLLVGG